MVDMLEVIRRKFDEGLKLCLLYLLYDEPVIHCFCKECLALSALSIPLLATAQGSNICKLRWAAFLSEVVELVRVYTDD
jgi:hypothetical protein